MSFFKFILFHTVASVCLCWFQCFVYSYGESHHGHPGAHHVCGNCCTSGVSGNSYFWSKPAAWCHYRTGWGWRILHPVRRCESSLSFFTFSTHSTSYTNILQCIYIWLNCLFQPTDSIKRHVRLRHRATLLHWSKFKLNNLKLWSVLAQNMLSLFRVVQECQQLMYLKWTYHSHFQIYIYILGLHWSVFAWQFKNSLSLLLYDPDPFVHPLTSASEGPPSQQAYSVLIG